MNTKLKIAILQSDLRYQKAVAKKARIQETHLSLAINGRWNLTGVEKERIADVLQRPVKELFEE